MMPFDIEMLEGLVLEGIGRSDGPEGLSFGVEIRADGRRFHLAHEDADDSPRLLVLPAQEVSRLVGATILHAAGELSLSRAGDVADWFRITTTRGAVELELRASGPGVRIEFRELAGAVAEAGC